MFDIPPLGIVACRLPLTVEAVSNVTEVEHVWNVMAHAQKPDLVFQWNGRTSPFKLPGGGAVQSTTGSRAVHISGSNGSNAGYTMFWGRVQDHWLHTPLACFPFTSPTVRHREPSGFNWALQKKTRYIKGNAQAIKIEFNFGTLQNFTTAAQFKLWTFGDWH